MPAVRLADHKIWVSGESRALLSGEVHFWRLDRSVWPVVLDRVRELGLDVLSSYLCWDFHEVEPGKFEFGGAINPRRDVLSFLDLAAERGFWVLLRPGPYIYAEWPNSGIPERCVHWHRLHPRFVEESKIWMQAVVSAVGSRLATHGGPIVLWQADNEADPWFDVYGSQIGLSDQAGLFQEFLRTRYVHIADLNQAWNAKYADFTEARAVQTPAYAPFVQRYRDLVAFRHWYATEVVHWTTAEYRRLGVDVPIYANTYIDTVVQDLHAINSVCDLAGPDIYPTSGVADNADEHQAVLDSIRYARSAAPLAFIPEFEAGIWHGWHRWVGALSARHTEFNGLSAMLAGVHAWNWYMLVDRDSWYMSPITELGRFRPELSSAYADLVRLFRELDPPSLKKCCDTAVAFSGFERACDPSVGEALLRSLHAADIDYEFFDPESGRFGKPLLLCSGIDPSSLRRYVEEGGTLVCFQPASSDSDQPIAVSTAAAPQRLRLALGPHIVALSSASVFVYDTDADPIVAERIPPRPPTQEGGHAHVQLPVGERLIVGYTREIGRGRFVVLGLEPDPDLLVALHAWLGARIPSRAAVGARMHSAIFERANQRFLIVVNSAPEDRDALVELEAAATDAVDLRSRQHLPVTSSGIVVHVPARSGTAVRLS
jgi:glycosyl hydrolase family 35